MNINNLPKPLLTIPLIPSEKIWIRLPKRIKVVEFYAISDGKSKIYKEEDGLSDIGKQIILDPCKISYTNLFINGVLQPKDSYEVQHGLLKLKTEDVPIKGTSVILQMITL